LHRNLRTLSFFAVAALIMTNAWSSAGTVLPDASLKMNEVVPGVFVHFGVNALMTHENQ